MTREEAIKVLRNEEHENALDIPDSVYDDRGECINPDGLYRDVSVEDYCSATIRKEVKK